MNTSESDFDIYVRVQEKDFNRADDLVAPLSKEGIDVLLNWKGVGVLGGTLRGVKSHRRAVERAILEGKPVPAQVLADYPDLHNKTTGKFASISGTEKGDKCDGLLGYSRIYDLLVCQFENWTRANGMIPIEKGQYVSRFAFASNDPPESQVSITWAGRTSNCGTKIEITEVGKENNSPLSMEFVSNYHIAPQNMLHVIQMALQQAVKKAGKPWISEKARYGYGIRFLS